MTAREPVPIRSYRAVVDEVERRIYRVDRWRLPLPGGVEVRTILYALVAFAVLSTAGGLPVLGAALDPLPAGIRYLALPVLAGWVLAAWRVDGRAPHHALIAAVRFWARSKTLAGLRATRPAGQRLAPIAGIQVAAGGDGPGYRPGKVRGPARITLRYPARVEVARGRRDGFGGALPGGTRLRVSAAGRRVRPLAKGRELKVPAGAEVRFK